MQNNLMHKAIVDFEISWFQLIHHIMTILDMLIYLIFSMYGCDKL